MLIRELEPDDVACDFEKIREELLKWCVMPAYMNRDRRNFDNILGNICTISEWILHSNHLAETQELDEFDEPDDYGARSIYDSQLWDWYRFIFNPEIMQMKADEIAIDFNEPKCDLKKYGDEISDFVNYVVKFDYTQESLFDLKENLDDCAKRILEKSKI